MPTRLVTCADAAGARPGAMLEYDAILDLRAAGLGWADMQAVVEAGAAGLAAIRAAIAAPSPGALIAAGRATLLAPIPRPRRNVLCVGRNYTDHVAEGDRAQGKAASDLPKFPQFFTKVPETVIGPGAAIPDHKGITEWPDCEAELALVVGTSGRDIARDRALAHVYGRTIANDVTGRELQRRHGQWFKGKSLDRPCPLGPWLVPAEELDAAGVAIRLWVNGEQRQASRTRKMIFDVAEILHQLSAGFTLLPGDVVMTGTFEDVGHAMERPRVLEAGDLVGIEVEGIGRLANPVVGAA